MPSRYTTATVVSDCRPTTVWRSFSAGVCSRRRTSEVLMRSVSTKASFAPLTDFSIVGSDTARTFAVRASNVTALRCASNRSAAEPMVRSATSASICVRVRVAQLYTAPCSMRRTASREPVTSASRPPSVIGRRMSADTSPAATTPSSQHTHTVSRLSSPMRTVRISKSSQSENIFFTSAAVIGTSNFGCGRGCGASSRPR